MLKLCLDLNLISENGFFMLDQCRADRQSNRSAQFQGVNVSKLIEAVDSAEFSTDQRIWCERLAMHKGIQFLACCTECTAIPTNLIVVSMIALCSRLHERYFTPSVKSTLINRHHDYIANGNTARQEKSRLFFEELGLLSLLSESERHAMISNACKSLLSVHDGYNNFHNEPPFAERLFKLSSQQQVPKTAKAEFVATVITCSVGNLYGTSDRADIYYIQMVKAFSAEEIRLMLKIPSERTVVANLIVEDPRCKRKYRELVQSLDPSSVPASLITNYERALR